ncbi:MAG: hypothetical protein B0D88_07430, partial [Candidatus Sedimenticola endophacoides]
GVRTIGRLFTGPVRPEMENVSDLRTGEMLAAGVLSLGILLLGIFPAPALEMMSASISQLSGAFALYQ